MKQLLCTIALLFATAAGGQSWSTFLDSSRAINWSSAGFPIPSYSVNCATQLTGGNALVSGSGAAAGNTTKIQAALNSCDATHNVVNIPAGTWYFAGFKYAPQDKQVVRGAGANSTHLIFTSVVSCGGAAADAICMEAPNWTYSGNGDVQPGGAHACNSWSSGYAKGMTSITLTGCGSAPAVGQQMILDQANDSSDTGGVYMCDGSTSDCTYEGSMNALGRIIAGKLYSTQQNVQIAAVSGSGPYTVTISPGVYNTNIRTGQTPGAWFPGTIRNLGLENLTADATGLSSFSTLNMFSCYQCWVKGVTFINGDRASIWMYQTSHSVVRDSYFYGAQFHGATSYNIEVDESSDNLIENNIIQQVTVPLNLNGSSVGNVIAYNFVINDFFGSPGNYFAWPLFSHATANNFNLFEGNSAPGFESDNASGPADQVTLYRNLFTGYEPGKDNQTVPIQPTALSRNFNAVGNILGQPSFSNSYQQFPTSTTVWTGTGNSIYSMGSGGTGGTCSLNPGSSTLCDPVTKTSIMRWANWDIVTNATKFDSTEASPAANTYVAANFTSTYFNTLSHALPASLYYSSTPSWWPAGKAWPPIGPDVSTGNVGTCSGTYSGSQATTTGQCSGGTKSTAWGSHVTSIPAQDCYLTTLGGPPDGSGAALAFDADSCNPAVSGFTLSTSTAGSGTGTVSCTPSGAGIAAGTGYSCTIAATGGSTLSGVTGCSGSGTTTYTGSMPASNCTVAPTFTAPVGVPGHQKHRGGHIKGMILR